jgi:hypothetical protein
MLRRNGEERKINLEIKIKRTNRIRGIVKKKNRQYEYKKWNRTDKRKCIKDI